MNFFFISGNKLTEHSFTESSNTKKYYSRLQTNVFRIYNYRKAVEYNLGGVVAWSIDTDDFKGSCEKETDYVSVSYSSLHDFAHKYNRIANNPVLEGILKDRNLPSGKLHSMIDKIYVSHN